MNTQQLTKINNLVAKYAQTTGAGEHVPKQGKHVPRCKDKRNWRQEVDLCVRNGYNR